MKKNKPYKVRFNLSRGVNFMKWKITHPDGNVEYICPNEYQLFMDRCTLRNNRKTAERIFNGENKSVCSWILCENVSYKKYPTTIDLSQFKNEIKYNPRVQPHWVYDNDKMEQTNVDNKSFSFIFSQNKQLFTHFKPY